MGSSRPGGGLAAPSHSSVFGSAINGSKSSVARPNSTAQRPASSGGNTFRSVTSSRTDTDARIKQERERMTQDRRERLAAAAAKQRAQEDAYYAKHGAPTAARPASAAPARSATGTPPRRPMSAHVPPRTPLSSERPGMPAASPANARTAHTQAPRWSSAGRAQAAQEDVAQAQAAQAQAAQAQAAQAQAAQAQAAQAQAAQAQAAQAQAAQVAAAQMAQANAAQAVAAQAQSEAYARAQSRADQRAQAEGALLAREAKAHVQVDALGGRDGLKAEAEGRGAAEAQWQSAAEAWAEAGAWDVAPLDRTDQPLPPWPPGNRAGERPSSSLEAAHPRPGTPNPGAPLGKGAFARVRLGRDKGGRPMAVKVYQHKEAEEQPCVARHLYNEARLAGRLEHANIIAPRRAVHRDGRTELEMEFAPGGNLGEYVARRRGLTEPQARRIFAQLVEGVGYLHAKDIAHRDIKLENVVLGANGTAKLCDFGAAREGARDLTRSIQGTPAYMAPECHAGAPHRAAPADLWCAYRVPLPPTCVKLLLKACTEGALGDLNSPRAPLP
eukprot:scaffold3616_cov124-Isochrysis_galbana.AAC.3